MNVTFHESTDLPFPTKIDRHSFRLGEWILTPRAATFLSRSPHAHLKRAGECVRLHHCSAEMEQFALSMALIAAAFSRRLDDIVGTRRS
ncbi:hypothetical protein EHYA_00736 [Embleya hyalina]|uniref:Uncharacterized protein n=1 Tax=Embleya hyalina TaxID=516124 RepID=A0A401YER3_9ACTN|nr:hypothetical protein EHYA_00736 [Embleya hyalina]